MTKIRGLLTALVLLMLLLPFGGASATVQFFPADSPTVGSDSLDAILGDGSVGVYEALADGDSAMVITTGQDVCIYVLDADANEATSSESPCPQYVAPLTRGDCTTCSWVLVDVNGISFALLPSAEPGFTGYDSDQAADAVIRLYGDSIDATDSRVYLQARVTDALVTFAELDGGTETVDLLYPLHNTNAVLVTPTLGNAQATDIAFGADPADAGTVMLANNDSIRWEASPAGNDVIGIRVTAAEVVEIGPAYATAVTITPATDIVGALTAASVASDAAVSGTTGTFTGVLAGLGDPHLVTDASLDLTNSAGCDGDTYYNDDADAVDFTLPPAVAGLTCCFQDIAGGVITIDVDDGVDTIYLNSSTVGAGDAIDSPGAVNDLICVQAVDDTRWYTWGRTGTWVDGGAD